MFCMADFFKIDHFNVKSVEIVTSLKRNFVNEQKETMTDGKLLIKIIQFQTLLTHLDLSR